MNYHIRTSVNTKIEYVLYVSSVTPNVGSIRGGTVATVYGDGFRYKKDALKTFFR